MTRLRQLLPSRRAGIMLLLMLTAAQLASAIALWHKAGLIAASAVQEGRFVTIALETGIAEGLMKPPEPKHADENKPDAAPASATDDKSPHITAPVSGDTALTPFDPNLSETADNGLILPAIGKDGMKPWQAYANKTQITTGKPMVAILVVGVGISVSASDLALRLPPQVTLSLSPYVQDTKPWADAARVRGHEILLDIPVQTNDYPANDPGPLAMLTMNMPQENAERLKQWMGHTKAYIGGYTPRDEAFFANRETALPVLKEVAQRGLVLVMGNNGSRPDVDKMLQEAASTYIMADIQLDASLDPEDVATQLAAASSMARERGYVLAVTRPYPAVLAKLGDWIETLSNQGIVIVPVSALVRKKFS